jgi:hypothetical protein
VDVGDRVKRLQRESHKQIAFEAADTILALDGIGFGASNGLDFALPEKKLKMDCE